MPLSLDFRLKMKLTANRSIVVCFLLNALQVWYLCDEYFRFEVTTSIRISIPDVIEFPSFTLCLHQTDTIHWKKISVDLRKTLLEETYNESYVESHFDLNNVTFHYEIPEKIIESRQEPSLIWLNMVDNLAGPQELFNATLDFTELMNFADVYMNLDHELKDMRDDVVVRETFALGRHKCYSVHLPKINRISFNELRASASREKGVINTALWILYSDMLPPPSDGIVYIANRDFVDKLPLSSYGFFYISSRDHIVTPVDANLLWKPQRKTFAEYQTYEETLMPAPYRTNCRNYKESGFSSRDHCRHQCLRSELMRRFNYLTLNVKLYENDNTSLLMPNSTREFWKSQVSDFFDAGTFVEVTFQNLYKKKCVQPDCQSILHIINNIGYSNSPWTEILLRHSMNPVTVTVTQAAVPLITFLTNLLWRLLIYQ